MPTTQPKKLTKEQQQIWDILSDNYGDQAHRMLDEIYKNGKINYRKADKYFNYIMDNWPNEEVFRATKTWLTICPLDSRKLKTFAKFTKLYSDLIMNHTGKYELYQKHTRSPKSLTKSK